MTGADYSRADLLADEARAFAWARGQKFRSVSAEYAGVLAAYIARLQP